MTKLILFAAIAITTCFSIYLSSVVNITSAQSSTPCPKATADPRAEGLISSESISGRFDNTSGACVIDPKATFAQFELPKNYEELKRTYYSKAKQIPGSQQIYVPHSPPASLAIELTTINGIYNTTASFTANTTSIPNTATATKTAVVFIDQNLVFTEDLIYPPKDAGIVFVVKGDVQINTAVHRIDAVIISFGQICTNYSPTALACLTTAGATAEGTPLTINGSIISLTSDQNKRIVFGRRLIDNRFAAEVINQQPKFLIILRDLFSSPLEIRTEL